MKLWGTPQQGIEDVTVNAVSTLRLAPESGSLFSRKDAIAMTPNTEHVTWHGPRRRDVALRLACRPRHTRQACAFAGGAESADGTGRG